MYRAATVLLLATSVLAATCSCSSAQPVRTPSAQVDTWAAAPDRLTNSYQDRTIREIVHTTIGGGSVRLRLSNVFGSAPVRFDSVWVGAQSGAAGVVANSNQRVQFAKADTVTVPVGAEIVSDPVNMTVHPGENLTVSIHVDGDTGKVTGHQRAQQQGWYADGDAAADTSGAPYTHQVDQWFWLDAATVQPSYPAHTIVAIGDSITDGFRSTADTNHRWPNLLADRLGPSPQFGVADEGIAGNQVTADGSGVSAEARLQRDVLAQPDVSTVIYLEGINDIGGHSVTSAAELIKADSLIIARVHAAGLRILGGTLTPFDGFHTYSPTTEAIRQAVNNWIRTSHAFDGVIDFDAAVRDPSDAHRLRPTYDSGDHLHPNDAGYQAMANAVPIQDLR
ncbi:MAG TPA: SGNH/GDSL hydrolase family protein [Pseudonocardiaceae bacterium]|jgi:lysophospholipase L1-like esterase|nr:SGNH/GDSL hydrolase family protein [Pseudonocardiaceae bacterium]